jgi:predicted ATPase/DNA-binding CsgD family transcriptional regulator
MPDAAQQPPTSSRDARRGQESSVVAFPRSTQERSLNNLPLELSSFVGREPEIAEVKRLLLEDKNRLLTLTGTGGCGKTRLALAVASDLVQQFEDGVWLVELASLSDSGLVAQAVASTLGVREAQDRSLIQTLSKHLESRKMLLVLDNCEHLLEGCAALAYALLRACPNLRILATSREGLGIAGERAWLVPSLSLPDSQNLPHFEELARYEALQLFGERAAAVASAFELTERNAPAVAGLCQRLDGIPLAVELAAARVRVLSVEQIASRLDDCFSLLTGGSRTALPRHRTLRATIEWSHDLLSEKEKVLFRRLSVFTGGFTVESTEKVCAGEGIEPEEVLDLLAQLVDKSLVLVAEQQQGGAEEEARYRLLETVRQYGVERLEESGEAELVQEQHAQYYLRLAEEAEPELREQGAWLERLGTEHANLRAALGWALGAQDGEEPAEGRAKLGLRLAAALAQGRFWNAYGPSEGRRWLERGLARSGASPLAVRAKALSQAGFLAIWQGDYQRSAALLEEGMALFKQLGDKAGVATSLFHLGNMALHGADHERASALRREAEALRPELADRQAIGLLLYFLGMAALSEGDHDRTVALAEEGLALNRELGDLRGMAMCLTLLGISALDRDDPERAAALYEDDLRVLRGLKDKTGTAYGLRGMAGVASLRGDATRAARLWGAAEALGEAIGLPLSPLDRSHPDYARLLAAARSQLDEAAWEAARAEGKAMTPEQAIEYALTSPSLPTPQPKNTSELSPREVEVLTLVAEGLTDAQVAQRLYLSPRTVGQHLRSSYQKLGASSRTAAVQEAVRRGLI